MRAAGRCPSLLALFVLAPALALSIPGLFRWADVTSDALWNLQKETLAPRGGRTPNLQITSDDDSILPKSLTLYRLS
jgi:hypothetical protein